MTKQKNKSNQKQIKNVNVLNSSIKMVTKININSLHNSDIRSLMDLGITFTL